MSEMWCPRIQMWYFGNPDIYSKYRPLILYQQEQLVKLLFKFFLKATFCMNINILYFRLSSYHTLHFLSTQVCWKLIFKILFCWAIIRIYFFYSYYTNQLHSFFNTELDIHWYALMCVFYFLPLHFLKRK